MPNNAQIKQFAQQCKKSTTFFIENCCKIKHPILGIIPFKLFKYQKRSIKEYRENRFNIFKKCRQTGISTLTGAYCLWFGMFFPNKKILIVSKRDQDAKEFLSAIKTMYNYLPGWMKEVWKTSAFNEHEIGFINGTTIKSLTSSADTLRSNASSLNIIDEAAFMPNMDNMWAGGWSTLQHGGSVIVISTPCGVGNWYWDKWTDAESGGLFNPILINWWDMDWVIEADDPVSGKKIRIAPTDGIRKCTKREEIEKWGLYYSPWLEQEYRGLQAKGESHLFRQEVLGEFIGSGGTVLSASALFKVGKTVESAPQAMAIAEPVPWINQATGDREMLEFEGEESIEGLWIWKEPIQGTATKFSSNKVTNQGQPGHNYVMGIDIATSENNDYSAIEIYDIHEMEQVAEYMGRVEIRELAKMADWLGRWYNNALACPERTGIGIPFIQDFRSFLYPNIWRQRKPKPIGSGQKSASGSVSLSTWGFATSPSSKPTLNKALIQFIAEDDGEGYQIYSSRLYKQLQIYIRHRNRHGIETKKTGAQLGRGNHDDLVIASALCFIAAPDAVSLDPTGLLPTRSKQQGVLPTQLPPEKNNIIETTRDPNVIVPLTFNQVNKNAPSTQEQLNAFANQIISTSKDVPAVSIRKKLKINK